MNIEAKIKLSERDINEINKQNSDGETALIIASFYNLDNVNTLLDAGADVNIYDNINWSALTYICFGDIQRVDLIEKIMKKCTKLNSSNAKKLLIAILSHSGCSTSSYMVQVLQLLFDNNNNIKINHKKCDHIGITLRRGNLSAVKILIENSNKLNNNKIIKYNSAYIYEIIYDTYLYNFNMIEPFMTYVGNNLKNKAINYQRLKTIIKLIKDNQIDIYYKPYNICALLCQNRYERYRKIKLSHKLNYICL